VDKQVERTTYRIYRSSLHALLVVGVFVMLAGDRIRWANCATGFLWRAWLFLYILPWWLAAAGRPADHCGALATKLTLSFRVSAIRTVTGGAMKSRRDYVERDGQSGL